MMSWLHTNTNYEGIYRCKREHKSLHEINGVLQPGIITDSCTIVISRADVTSNIYQVNIDGNLFSMQINDNRIDGGARIYGKINENGNLEITHIPSLGPEAYFYKGIKR